MKAVGSEALVPALAIEAESRSRRASAEPSPWLFAGVALLSLAGAAVLRWLYLVQAWRIDWATFPMFLGDEGAHGLMAMHIQEGARPVFYYGAYYHGAFDAYLTAILFGIFGESLSVLRLTPTLFSFVLIAASYAAAKRMYGQREGLMAAALVALPSKFVFEWGTLSLCGYCGYAAMVLLLLTTTLGVLQQATRTRLIVFGLVAGVSVWSNQLSVAYVAVCLAALWLWAPLRRQEWGVLVIAGLIGIAPLIYGNIETPFSTFRQLARKALFAWTLVGREGGKQEVEAAAASATSESGEGAREYQAFPLLEILGAQPGRDGAWSAADTAGAVVLVLGALAAVRRCLRARRTDQAEFRRQALVLALVAVGLVMGIGGFSGQPIGRYQLPLYPLLAVLAAGWLGSFPPAIAAAVVALVAVAHAVTIATPAQTAETTPTSAAVDALESHGLNRGFAASPMYDVIFRSGEKIIVVPLDHSRYRPYEAQVDASPEVFYIYRTYQERKPAHRALLRHLAEGGVAYERLDAGDFHILHGFQPRSAMSLATVAEVRERFRDEKFGR